MSAITLPPSPTTPTLYVASASQTPAAPDAVMADWCGKLGHKGIAIVPIALGPEMDADDCSGLLDFLRDEHHAVGVWMRDHASALYDRAQSQFDNIDTSAAQLGEIAIILRQPGKLLGLAPAGDAAAQALAETLDKRPHPAEALIIGAGAHARALALALLNGAPKGGQVTVTVTSLDGKALTDLRQRIEAPAYENSLILRHIESPAEYDRLVTLAPPGALIANATGLALAHMPAPVSATALFPEDALVWDVDNPIAASPFLLAARRQRQDRNLTLADSSAFIALQWINAVAAALTAAPTAQIIARLRKSL